MTSNRRTGLTPAHDARALAQRAHAHVKRSIRSRGVARILAIAFALILTPFVALPMADAKHPVVAGATDSRVTYEWWDDAWHFRVPVLVKPELKDPFTPGWWADIAGEETWGYPAQLEFDFTQLVKEAGASSNREWPRDSIGRLSSFTLDTDSIRVVAYSRDGGKVDKSQGMAGSMPHVFSPTLLDNPERKNGVFNASSNAIGSVSWIIGQQQRPPGIPFREAMLYFVYFDIIENGKKTPAVFPDTMMGSLRSLWWMRQGTEFYGFAPAPASGSSSPMSGAAPKTRNIEVYPLHDNTTVSVSRYRFPGFPPDEIPLCKLNAGVNPCVRGQFTERAGKPVLNAIGLDRTAKHNSLQVLILEGDPFFFKVESTKPVFVAVRESGPIDPTGVLYPSLDGAPVGTRFKFVSLSEATDIGSPPTGGMSGLIVVTFGEDAIVDLRVESKNGQNRNRNPLPCEGRFDLPRRSVRVCSDAELGEVVTIASTAPIAVFSAGINNGFGTPAVDRTGAPIGSDLVAVGSQSLMAIPYSASEVRAYNYVDAAKEYPPGRTQVTKAGAQGAFTVTLQGHLLRGDIYAIDASKGRVAGQGGTWAFWQPGGDLAMHYELPLWIDSEFGKTSSGARETPHAIITSLYDDTRVEIFDYRTNTVIYRRTMNQDEFFVKKPGESSPLLQAATTPNAYRVTSSKPIFVSVNGAPGVVGSYYQGIARAPRAEFGEVEFFGPLVGWVEKTKTSTFKPGDQAQFTFTLTNLGTAIGGKELTDSFLLKTRVTTAPDSWTPEPQLSSAVATDVASGGTREVTLVVTIPETASTGDAVEVELVATSKLNPRISDVARAQMTIQTKYEFAMKFQDGGLKTKSRILEAGAPSSFIIEVQNTGTGDDNILFNTRVDKTGAFKSVLIDSEGRSLIDSQGRGIRALSIPIGERKFITLRVTAPIDKNTAYPPFEAPVEGVSQTDSAIRDLVIATALTNVKTSLRLSVDDPEILVEPGEVARFPLTIQNEGVETEIKLSLAGAIEAGWNVTLEPTRLSLRGPGSFDEATGKRQDIGIVNVSIVAADPSPVRKIVPLKITATSLVETRDDTLKGTSIVLTARVVNNFTIVTNEDLIFERPANPGDAVLYTFDYLSRANGPVNATIIATNLPPGWRLEADARSKEIFPGDDGQLRATVHVKPNEQAGPYTASIGILMEDEDFRREIREINVTIRVKRVLDYALEYDSPILVPPAGEARIPFTIRHVGNAPFSATIALEAPPGWNTASFLDAREAAFDLKPGEVHRLNVSLRAPPSTDGAPVNFTVTGTIEGSDFPDGKKTTDVPVAILRRDLEMVRVRLAPPRADIREGESVVFVATVLNNGTVPVDRVQVALLVDGLDVRNVTLRALRPNQMVNVTFSWNVIRGSSVVVAIDPFDEIAEINEGNNAIPVDFANIASVNVPGFGSGALIAAFAAVALAAHHRTPFRRRRS